MYIIHLYFALNISAEMIKPTVCDSSADEFLYPRLATADETVD